MKKWAQTLWCRPGLWPPCCCCCCSELLLCIRSDISLSFWEIKLSAFLSLPWRKALLQGETLRAVWWGSAEEVGLVPLPHFDPSLGGKNNKCKGTGEIWVRMWSQRGENSFLRNPVSMFCIPLFKVHWIESSVSRQEEFFTPSLCFASISTPKQTPPLCSPSWQRLLESDPHKKNPSSALHKHQHSIAQHEFTCSTLVCMLVLVKLRLNLLWCRKTVAECMWTIIHVELKPASKAGYILQTFCEKLWFLTVLLNEVWVFGVKLV